MDRASLSVPSIKKALLFVLLKLANPCRAAVSGNLQMVRMFLMFDIVQLSVELSLLENACPSNMQPLVDGAGNAFCRKSVIDSARSVLTCIHRGHLLHLQRESLI